MTGSIRSGDDMIEARSWARTDLELSGKSLPDLEARLRAVAERLSRPLSRTEAAMARGEGLALVQAIRRTSERDPGGAPR